jgi:OFA family oxalate/formate antiporter-like MFS transporter
MLYKNAYHGFLVLFAASIVSSVLGSIHAFSVFIAPLETQFNAPRSSISLSYSLALMTLTVAVLFGPRVYGRFSAAAIIFFACILAAFGVFLAGIATSLSIVWIGYSLIFGLSNGLGYGFGLQIAAQVNPGREGLAMGIVTAAYALGAVVSPALFDQAVISGGFSKAMNGLAIILIFVGIISAFLMWLVNAKFQLSERQTLKPTASTHNQPLLWLAYFGGVLAGLMVIGHAAEIAVSLRPDIQPWRAPAVIAVCNLLGSLLAGRMADKYSLGFLLSILALITSIALVILALFGSTGGMMIGFGAIGFAYGGTIAAYPTTISKLFGAANGAVVYGRIFTAWGSAGLIGPSLAGFLFDRSGGYTLALLTAAVIGLISAVVIRLVFNKTSHIST